MTESVADLLMGTPSPPRRPIAPAPNPTLRVHKPPPEPVRVAQYGRRSDLTIPKDPAPEWMTRHLQVRGPGPATWRRREFCREMWKAGHHGEGIWKSDRPRTTIAQDSYPSYPASAYESAHLPPPDVKGFNARPRFEPCTTTYRDGFKPPSPPDSPQLHGLSTQLQPSQSLPILPYSGIRVTSDLHPTKWHRNYIATEHELGVERTHKSPNRLKQKQIEARIK